MSFADAVLTSLLVAGLVFAVLLLMGLIRLVWRRPDRRPWRESLAGLGHYCAIRALVAIAVGGSFLAVVLAALTLNTQRPPADTTPVVRAQQPTRSASVTLRMDDCEQPISGRVFAPPLARGRTGGFARIYSDDDGFQRVELDRRGRGRFELSDPSSRRGLLSCYLPLPVIGGIRGPSLVRLELSEDLEVDTTESIPGPAGYFSGSWLWRCPAGQSCPSMATIEYDLEDGAKQVIVLILASVFGAIIAILVTEVVLGAARRRLSRRSDD